MQKINLDPYYADLQDILSPDRIFEAGFFEDSWPVEKPRPVQEMLHCTPIYLVSEKLKNAQNPCVLLSTGAFCPIHDGHIEMMEKAKICVEKKGFGVLSGYFSPGHDEYIHLKTQKKAIPIWERLKLIEDKCPNWLFPEPWEGLYCPIAVNFTEVIQRLENYLFQIFHQKIPVFYVCGADNARFALTFLKKGHCVVIGRSGYEDRFEKYQKELKSIDRILWGDANVNISSTEIRNQTAKFEPKSKKLYLRTENQDERESEILNQLQKYFSDIQLLNLQNQIKDVEELFQKNENILSLDAFLPAKYHLEISRVYDVGGCRKIGYINRPGSKKFVEQLKNLPKHQSYILFDDDIFTGGTIKFAQDLLSENQIKTAGILTLHHSLATEEVLDMRDFIIGGKNNGLVIKYLNNYFRVPYLLPFVCPWQRAHISDPLVFSIEIWKINEEYFLKNPVTCAQFPSYYPLFEMYEIPLSSQMSSFCSFFVRMLNHCFND